MDNSAFAHLRPKDRTDEYAARVAKFIGQCPEDLDANGIRYRGNAYWQIIRAYKSIDFGDGYRARWHTDSDQYRVRTKLRRCEARNIVYYLPLLDLYGDSGLEDERVQLLAIGRELIAFYDAIIKACQ